MKFIKPLSLAIYAATATAASAFEVEFDSADVEYGYKNHSVDHNKILGIKSDSASDHELTTSVKFKMDYSLYNKTEFTATQRDGTRKFKISEKADVDESATVIRNEFGWKNSNYGKVAYAFGLGNSDGSIHPTSASGNARKSSQYSKTNSHELITEAYFDMFTLGANYNNEISIRGKDNSTENLSLMAKAYPTEDISIGYEHGYLDYAGKNASKNINNKVAVDSWWLDGMLSVGADYAQQDAIKHKDPNTAGGLNIGFRPLMLTDKITTKLAYESGREEGGDYQAYTFSVALATDGVSDSLKDDDR